MNYELAKQLKDAGFDIRLLSKYEAQEAKKECIVFDETKEYLGGGKLCYEVPTLSELIEACGDIVLWKNGDEWSADVFNGKGEIYIDEYFSAENGATPEEAVANLWLALQASSKASNSPAKPR